MDDALGRAAWLSVVGALLVAVGHAGAVPTLRSAAAMAAAGGPAGLCAAVDCGPSLPAKQLVPGDVQQCESGVYCECVGDAAVAEAKMCPELLGETMRLNPDDQNCWIDFDCYDWILSHNSTTTTTEAYEENTADSTLCSEIDCLTAGRWKKQLVPGDVQQCESGVYCECVGDAAAAEAKKCPTLGVFQSKLDPDSQECEYEYECSSAIVSPPTPAADQDDDDDDDDDDDGFEDHLPQKYTCDAIDCRTGGPSMRLAPGDAEQCEAGVYCECGVGGAARRRRCAFWTIFHSRFDPYHQACVQSFDCAAWARDHPAATQDGPPGAAPALSAAEICAIVALGAAATILAVVLYRRLSNRRGVRGTPSVVDAKSGNVPAVVG